MCETGKSQKSHMETNINNRYETGSHVQKHTQREASGRGPERPVAPCWREVSLLLQSVLQDADRNKQPAKPQTDLSFRDFFRTSLEATLEVSSWSRAYLAPQPQRSFKRPPVKQGINKDDSSSSFCLNCARLERKVAELQEKLSHLQHQQKEQDVEEQDVEDQSDTEQLDSDIAVEEDDTKWMEPLSPQSDSSDSSQNETFASSAAAHKRSFRHQFQKSWLKRFWFLRYSPSHDRMWCHVCRRHAKHQNTSLIRGSRTFRVSTIKRHSLASSHIESVERYVASVSAWKV